ncbi:MAG: MBL fold metallo-hydrolase [Proteobacteria bacterium]|nr:MBL fold metallo-hydrolase [Pseudomonadota bacterium]
MKLLFLGTASGLSESQTNYHSNLILVSNSGKKLLIDCGTDIRFSLAHANINPIDVDAVYISHLHHDHVGGLTWFAFKHKFRPKAHKPLLIVHQELAQPLWEHCLAGGMETLEDEQASLHSFFNVHSLYDNQEFHWEGASIRLVKTVHVLSNHRVMPSYGLILGYKKNKIFITTDTQFNKDLLPYYKEASLIFHDCETSHSPSGVHAHFEQLVNLDSQIKNKMWLYHYNDGVLPKAEEEGFLGFVKCGQEFRID